MAKMASRLKRVIHTPTGHTVAFPGGKQMIDVPNHLVADCLKQGAYLHPSEALPEEMDETETPATKEALSSDERKRRAVALIKEMLESPEKHRANFTATGRPSSRFLHRELGFKVQLQEIEEWFELAKS